MIDVHNPATESVIASVPVTASVTPAVEAARAAQPAWAELSRAERAAHLARLRDLLTEHADELAGIITAEMGAPLSVARKVQVGLPITVLSSTVAQLEAPEQEVQLGNSRIVRDPVGVVGAITPWNYPLHQTVAKLAPALAAGNTVVHKPSEVAPLSALRLHELVREAGLPDGVYNLVTGYGDPTGAELAGHPGIDLISFTGSTTAGRKVAALAAANVTRVALELGGKSANVILPDADHTAAVKVGVANCFLNSGQTCTAWTRMLVHESRYDEAVELAVAAAAKYTVGDPTDPSTRLGPLASAAQRDRVLSYVERGVAGGAKMVHGGGAVPEVGYYVAPVVFADVDPDAVIAQEEIFGPVLSIIRYRDEDDAVRIANGTRYGLAGSVWSASQDHAVAVARRLRTGQVDVNGGAFNPLAPFGGIGHSGYGRELGTFGYEEFTTVKAIQL
ncbi:aldehyde dehydrogenase family protein [Dactylosporangium fulvum]|uniref:aldehyde dehydrogenase family protein n=1 Tax=Dactylosporangium fulvum TaxID=53359 RepID=UPI0029D4111F|nr:aldehyde dehydrogenase family protein [Dactylosporangium fulvum]